jgi:hypothetical protein
VRSVIAFGGSPQDVAVTVSGTASRTEFRLLYEDIAGDPRFRPGLRILLDFTELDVTDLAGREADEIGRHLAGLEDSYGAALLAVVVPDALTFDLARTAELSGGFERMKVLLSYDRDEALRWLESEPDPAAS